MGGVALALSLVACGSGGSASGDGTINVATSQTASDAPFIIGSEAGIWDKHGLKVENVPVQGSAPAFAGLANGSIQTVHQGPVVMAQANQKGADLRFFCGAGATIWNGFIVASDGPLAGMSGQPYKKKIEALKGRNIGISALKSTTEMLGNMMLEAGGLSGSDVSYVAVGYGEGALSALKQGRVDAIVTYPFLTQQGEDAVELLVDIPNEKDAPADMFNTMNSGWIANKEWLDENPETAKKFCGAFGDALTHVTAEKNRDAVAGKLQKSFGIPSLGVAKEVISADGPLSLLSTKLDCGALQRSIELAEKQGQIKTDPKMTCDNMIWKAPQA
ncbi:ABC transporter substrate-binding protein [Actinomadura sp. KC345]|uniref:ABC transporter substrate-binding protein n=1 Tax=Actinomadura sp. KC345 TaxID=2530371 RepID=UPI001404435F|nr:ABC transporter substrate-binding protein [Actinomadura sp. KC345]